MPMKNLTKTILGGLAIGFISCALFSQQAQATQITGEIHMAGDVIFDSVDLSSSTAVNHWISALNNLEKATTFGATGDFTAIPTGTEADMTHPWTFSPSTPTAPLWNVAAFGFSFDLASITSVTKTGDNFLNVLASGTVHATGFDDTPAMFSFTVDNPDGKTHLTYSFADATVTGVTVPDGGSAVALLGIALIGIEGLRRKLKAA
jgi:protein with PEP-CTERM/exosortase system signal